MDAPYALECGGVDDEGWSSSLGVQVGIALQHLAASGHILQIMCLLASDRIILPRVTQPEIR